MNRPKYKELYENEKCVKNHYINVLNTLIDDLIELGLITDYKTFKLETRFGYGKRFIVLNPSNGDYRFASYEIEE